MSSIIYPNKMLFVRSNVIKARCSFFDLLIMLALMCTFLTAYTDGAQKFVPNGRYGRRSDLPPLDINQFINDAERTPNADQSNHLRQGLLVDDFTPLWCLIIDLKNNMFKCFERYSFGRSLRRNNKLNDVAGVANLNNGQGQSYQDQS